VDDVLDNSLIINSIQHFSFVSPSDVSTLNEPTTTTRVQIINNNKFWWQRTIMPRRIILLRHLCTKQVVVLLVRTLDQSGSNGLLRRLWLTSCTTRVHSGRICRPRMFRSPWEQSINHHEITIKFCLVVLFWSWLLIINTTNTRTVVSSMIVIFFDALEERPCNTCCVVVNKDTISERLLPSPVPVSPSTRESIEKLQCKKATDKQWQN